MNKFILNIDENITQVEGEDSLSGYIQIDDFYENCFYPVSYWSRDDYLLQWRHAIDTILLGGKKAAFIVSMRDPESANFIFWWVMYVVGDVIYLQNHVLFLEEISERFTVESMYLHIQDREIANEDGEKISEWVISKDCLKDFLKEINVQLSA